MLPKGITFTHTDGSTYTTGNRGKPPAWLKSHPEYIKLLETTPATPNPSKPLEVAPSGLKAWRWNDQDGLPMHICVVVARDIHEAIRILNKRFQFPVGSHEFTLMWKEITPSESMLTPGVYEPNQEKVLALRS